MREDPVTPTTEALEAAPEADQEIVAGLAEEDVLLEELLVEEVSIDGMCGVY